jgi:glycosyltransferase involved in cell wall biosynthesis
MSLMPLADPGMLMRYTITFPIPILHQGGSKYLIPTGLFRDVAAQSKFTSLRILCLAGENDRMHDVESVDLKDFPNLTIRVLPYQGGRKKLITDFARIRSVLSEEAKQSDVWHSCCSLGLWDLTTVAYQIGRHHARGLKVFALDSDPVSMLRESGILGQLKAGLIRQSLLKRVQDADLTILVGQGVVQTYAQYTRNHVVTDAVWLLDGDLASETATREKFAVPGPVRVILPSRLLAWKGVDDSIEAFSLLRELIGSFSLDIIGEGPEKARLTKLCAHHHLDDRVRFLDPVPYGEPFFQLLRQCHVVLLPTRGLEDVRIAYDAAASGCVIIHSNTKTLEHSVGRRSGSWAFEPGNAASFAAALAQAFSNRESWGAVAIGGIRAMKGRTIENLHRARNEAVIKLWEERVRLQA